MVLGYRIFPDLALISLRGLSAASLRLLAVNRSTAAGDCCITCNVWAFAAEVGTPSAYVRTFVDPNTSVTAGAPVTGGFAAVAAVVVGSPVAFPAATTTLQRAELAFVPFTNAVAVAVFVAITNAVAVRIAMTGVGPEEVFSAVVHTVTVGVDVERIRPEFGFQ